MSEKKQPEERKGDKEKEEEEPVNTSGEKEEEPEKKKKKKEMEELWIAAWIYEYLVWFKVNRSEGKPVTVFELNNKVDVAIIRMEKGVAKEALNSNRINMIL